MARVFINPGHALGVDPGAINVEMDVSEAKIVKNIGRKVADYLDAAGCHCRVLQSDNLCGESPEYPNVCESANSWADLFISLHCNAASSAARGTETFVFRRGGEADSLARCIQTQIVDNLGTVDRGVKENPRLIVLKHTATPAVLVELAFISNNDDCQMLIDKQDKFARAIARGVTDYLSQ